MLFSHDADVAMLTETWLSSEIFDSEFVPKGYKVFRGDRDRRGGGVAILYKSSLQLFSMPDAQDIEAVFCKAYINKARFILGVFYRPPNSSAAVLENLREYMHCHVKSDDRILLAGDFNLPNIDWHTFSLHSAHSIDNTIFDIVFTFDLLQMVNNFTRVQGAVCSILDLFFVSGAIRNAITCEVTNGISDHKAVLLSLSNVYPDHKNGVHLFPNFSRADDESILDMLAFYFDDFRNSTCNVNDLWLSFRGIVSECIQRFVPTIAKSSVHRNPWISRETLRLQRRLKRLKVKARTNVTLKSIVEGTSEQLKQKIICDKEKYYGTILPSFIKTSPERFWRQITPKSSSTSGFMIDGKCVSDETVVCSAFNKFFQSVFTKDNGCLPNFSISLPVISDVVISESGVFNLLLNVDTKKSPGPDKIPNAFLKRYAEWCAKYLYVVFTRSLRDGSLPDDWRTAEIKPLHKSGNKTHIDNYRPVSLTSTSCKILEHIIHKHILSFLEEHKVLTDVQHGFRHRFSTCTQLVETVHDLAQAINEGKQTDIVFMDFRKAFDKVSHNKLIHKLEYYIKMYRYLHGSEPILLTDTNLSP